MFGLLAGVCVGLSLVTLVMCGRFWSPATLLLGSMVPVVAGLAVLRTGVGHLIWIVPAFMLFFAIGVAAQSRRRDVPVGSENPDRAEGSIQGWVWAGAVIIGLSALHFLSVGVVSLSNEAEIARFDLDSGFLGIPSRAVIFGLPILVLAFSMRTATLPRAAVIAVWIAFVLSRAALGFKSGILEVFIVAVTVVMCRQRRLTFNATVALGVVFIGALTYASWVGGKYGSITEEILSPTYLADRLGRQSAEAVTGGIALGVLDGFPSFALNDLQYFGQKYTQQELTPGLYPVDHVVSSAITGMPLSRSSFLVPVTVGGPAYLFGSVPFMPTLGVPILAFFLGRLWERASGALATSSGDIAVVGAAAMLIGLRAFVLSGGGVYLMINCGAIFVLIVTVYSVGRRISPSAKAAL